MHRRTLTLVFAFAVAGAFAFPSAAAPLFTGTTDQLGNDVELAPSSDYAYLDGDDELVVDLSPSNPDIDGEGVNPNSRTTIGDVFRVRYNASEYADTPGYAEIWLTHGSDAVTFAVDGEPIQSRANNVTLSPNESVAVSITVDTTRDTVDGLVDDITVHSRVTEPEEAEELEVDEDVGVATQSVAFSENSRRFTALSADPGQPVRFDASRLALDRAGNGSLTFDGLSVTSQNRTFSVVAESAGGSEARSLVVDDGSEPLGAVGMTVSSGRVSNATMRFSATESYFEARGVDPADLTVYRYSDGELSRLPATTTGERDGRLAFEAETPGFSTFVVSVKRPRLAVADAGLDTATVAPGETVTVSASVSNTGTLAGERSVAVAVDGTVVAEPTVTVPSRENGTVSVPIVREETGEYTVTVDGVDVGTFSVSSEQTTTPAADDGEPAPPTNGGTDSPVGEASGFGLQSLLGLVGLLIIVATTLVLARRTPRP